MLYGFGLIPELGTYNKYIIYVPQYAVFVGMWEVNVGQFVAVGIETGVGYISWTQNFGSTRKRTGLQYASSSNELIVLDVMFVKFQTSTEALNVSLEIVKSVPAYLPPPSIVAPPMTIVSSP